MPKREIEGDWVMGWPDRKRAVALVKQGIAALASLEGDPFAALREALDDQLLRLSK